MQSFGTIDELWISVCDSILSEGAELDSRAGKTKELLGWSGILTDPQYCFLFNPERKLSPSYAAGEFIWYMSGERIIDRIQYYAPQYVNFADENGFAYGAYGARLASYTITDSDGWDYDEPPTLLTEPYSYETPLEDLIRNLKENPNSRQAILPIFRAVDLIAANSGECKDIPCTLSLQFLLRDKKLNCICTMRSNDAWLGLPYDVFCFCHLQMVIANRLGVETGFYQHQVGSMHLYEKHWVRAGNALYPKPFAAEALAYVPMNPHDVAERLRHMILSEEHNRLKSTCADNLDPCGTPNQLPHRLVLMAATKHSRSAVKRLPSFFKSFLEKHHASD